MRLKRYKHPEGFSLIEIVLIIGIIGVLAAVVSLPFAKFRQTQALENTTNAVIAILNEARTRTLGAVGNTSYSVRVESDQAILFTGTSYNLSTPSNQILSFETPVTMTGITLNGGGSNVSFDRLKGTTSQNGTIILSLPNGLTRTILVSATGSVSRN
jgi:type II secretory pathway pseudopilin PulG